MIFLAGVLVLFGCVFLALLIAACRKNHRVTRRPGPLPLYFEGKRLP